MILLIPFFLGMLTPVQSDPLKIHGTIYIENFYIIEYHKDSFNEVFFDTDITFQWSRDSTLNLYYYGFRTSFFDNFIPFSSYTCKNEYHAGNTENLFYVTSTMLNSYRIIGLSTLVDLKEKSERNNRIKFFWQNIRGDNLERYIVNIHLSFIHEENWIFYLIIERNVKEFNLISEVNYISRIIESIKFEQ